MKVGGRTTVLDASAIIAAISPDEEAAHALRRFADALASGATAPSLLVYECANVVLGKHRRGVLTDHERDAVLAVLAELPVTYVGPDPANMARRIVPLAARRGLSVYDAAYLDLAKTENRPLATWDHRLRTAAAAEGVAVL